MNEPPERRNAAFVAASVMMHGAAFAGIGWLSADGADFEFRPPESVEFGIVDGQLGGGARGAEREEPTPPAPAPKPVEKKVEVKPDPVVRPVVRKPKARVVETVEDVVEVVAETADAGPTEPSEAAETAVTEVEVATDQPAAPGFGLGDGFGVGFGGHGMGGFAPPGAQVGLYVDLKRVRSSSLILETRALLGIVPGWQHLLAGTGMDPLSSLSHVFVATPSLRRGDLVVSARHPRGHLAMRAAVDRRARKHGRQAEWRRERGYPVSAWPSQRGPERSVALVGDDHFVVTERGDLDRVLAMASYLAAGMRPGGAKTGPALRSALRDEAAALVVEDVPRFVEGDLPAVPKSLRLSLRPVDEFYADLTAIGFYSDEAAASKALAYFDERRSQWSEHPEVQAQGLTDALERALLRTEGQRVVIDVRVTLHQTRYLLAYVARAMRAR